MREEGRAAKPIRATDSKRAHERVPAAVPVCVDGHTTGLTRDISPSGVLFETDAHVASGSPIQFSLEFDNPGGKLILHCLGEVVRVEQAEKKTRVAVKIVGSRLERLP